MEELVDIVGNGEEKVQDITLQENTDPVVYQLVRVDGDGRLVPATDDEVIAVEEFLEDDKNNCGSPSSGRTLECSTSYGCGPRGPDDVQLVGSAGQSQFKVLEEDPQNPNVVLMDSDETGVQCEKITPPLIPNTSDDTVSQSGMNKSKTSNSPLGAGSKPNFSMLNGRLDLDSLPVKDLQETFKATFGRETSVKDKQWLKRRIIMGLTNSCDFSTTTFVIFDNILVKNAKEETRKAADDNADVMQIQSSHFQENCESNKDADTGQGPAKRIRKPTKRFIEELSEGESKYADIETVSLVKHPAKDKPSVKVCARPVQEFGLDGRCLTTLTRKDLFGGSRFQVPYVSRIRRCRPRENFMTLMKFQPSDLGISSRLEKNGVQSAEQLDHESGNEELKKSASPTSIQEPAFPSSERKKMIQLEKEVKPENVESRKTTSDDEAVILPTANGGVRRKHHRAWTLSEVVKLVEGVAKYGAGRWSEIKRVSFASYSYRTSVDLKDKWRNLLKASLAESPIGNRMPSFRKQTSVPIPKSILSRVRGLADMQTQVPAGLTSGRLREFSDLERTVHETSSEFL